MSTNANIGIECEFGLVEYIYNHWDGYIFNGGVGEMLLEHYNDYEKVKDLMAMGDVSILQKTLADSTFYHRDRNEALEGTQAIVVEDITDFFNDIQQYMYCFTEDGWIVKVYDFQNSLADAIEEGEEVFNKLILKC